MMMKNSVLKNALFLIFALFVFSACEDDEGISEETYEATFVLNGIEHVVDAHVAYCLTDTDSTERILISNRIDKLQKPATFIGDLYDNGDFLITIFKKNGLAINTILGIKLDESMAGAPTDDLLFATSSINLTITDEAIEGNTEGQIDELYQPNEFPEFDFSLSFKAKMNQAASDELCD